MNNLNLLHSIVEARLNNEALVHNGNRFYIDMHMWSQDSREHHRYNRHPCGTVGCILGLIQLVTMQVHTVETAGRWLGIDDGQAEMLMRPPNDFSWTKIDLPVVAGALKHLMDEGHILDYWKEIEKRGFVL